YLVYPFLRTARRAARTTIKLALDPSVLESNGLYWKNEKPVNCTVEANNPDIARQLWQVSEELLGISS
ncbi:MAG: short-chain dehydrogenase, partial [Myxococcota bacterium]|nr:short-chain dehydrogenase [Myxococcota bacterium]